MGGSFEIPKGTYVYLAIDHVMCPGVPVTIALATIAKEVRHAILHCMLIVTWRSCSCLGPV